MTSPAAPSAFHGLAPEVAALLQNMQDSWNASDLDAMFATATDDLHWVNVVGMHWQGRAQAKQAHVVFFEQMFRGVPLALEAVEHAAVLPGGVHLIVARWALGAYRTPPGEPRPASLNRMTLLAVPGPQGLQLRHVANVEVDPHAAPHDPALR
jgi:uncharacterized protein (TIGR02246 family)